MFRIDFVTLFPEMVRTTLSHSILGRATAAELVEFRTANPRDFCHDRHMKVDERPFGGEPGMLIRAEPVARAVEWLGRKVRAPSSFFRGSEAVNDDLSHREENEEGVGGGDSGNRPLLKATGMGLSFPRPLSSSEGISSKTADFTPKSTIHHPPSTAVVLTAPTGRPFDQTAARELAGYGRVVFLCGHYEGIDHRIEEALCTHVFSIGDYVLTNGELPALVMADAVVRLVPGVLGNEASLDADSFSDGLLSAPNYTRPVVWRGKEVPPVLLSGDHRAIARWRRRAALRLTREVRPDLLARARLEKADVEILGEQGTAE